MKPTATQVLMDKERPLLNLEEEMIGHLLIVSLQMMDDEAGPIEVRVHAMETYLQILKEMSLRN